MTLATVLPGLNWLPGAESLAGWEMLLLPLCHLHKALPAQGPKARTASGSSLGVGMCLAKLVQGHITVVVSFCACVCVRVWFSKQLGKLSLWVHG